MELLNKAVNMDEHLFEARALLISMYHTGGEILKAKSGSDELMKIAKELNNKKYQASALCTKAMCYMLPKFNSDKQVDDKFWEITLNYIKEATDLANEIFEMTVKKGIPDSVNGNPNILNNPRYSTGIGIIKYAFENKDTIQGDIDNSKVILLQITNIDPTYVSAYELLMDIEKDRFKEEFDRNSDGFLSGDELLFWVRTIYNRAPP